MAKTFENPPQEFIPVIQEHFKKYLGDVLALGKLAEKMLALKKSEKKEEEVTNLEDNRLLWKFYIPDNPSTGFLQPLVQTVLPKFESLASHTTGGPTNTSEQTPTASSSNKL